MITMKKIGIIPNFEKDPGLKDTRKIVEYIKSIECEPVLANPSADMLGEAKAVDTEELFKTSDFIVVLGGDGTLLKAAEKASIYDKPILGINFGTMGFLTDSEKAGAEDSILKAVNGQCCIEKRIMLSGSLCKQGITEEHYALNDICFSRGVFATMTKMTLYINGEYLESFRGDGVIICTPTGSTAYNLSAGGPIIKPNTDVVVITPICTHTLNNRSIVVPSEDVITIEIDEGLKSDVLLAMDGKVQSTLKAKDRVTITKSPYKASIIKTNGYGFYEVLRKKIEGKES